MVMGANAVSVPAASSLALEPAPQPQIQQVQQVTRKAAQVMGAMNGMKIRTSA